MRRWMAGATVIVLVIGAYVVFLRGGGLRKVEPPVLPAVKAEGQVVAEARVVPVRYVSLSLSGGGALEEVLVAEGDQVKVDQVLARLQTARQAAAAVSQAEAGVRGAQAKLAELRSGFRAQELEAARGSLDAAEAHYRQLKAGARLEEREQARIAVEQADGQVRAAAEAVRQADAELGMAGADVRRAEQLFAEGAVAEQAVDQARARFQSAQALDEAARAQLGVARAQAAAARQQQRLVLAGPRHEEIDAAAAEVHRTQAQLGLLEAGARPEAIAAAEADVAVAGANLRQAQEALALTELRAPLNGVVTAIVPHPHEFVAPGTPIVRLADTAAWEIETTDLSDLNIARVREGDPVAITFDGIPAWK